MFQEYKIMNMADEVRAAFSSTSCAGTLMLIGVVLKRQKEVLHKSVETDSFRWFKEKVDKFVEKQL